MFGKLSTHFSSLTDVRIVTDPWGLGMKIPLLRFGAEEWAKWTEDNKPAGGIGEAFQRAQLARMAERVVDQMDEPDKPGMRRRRKPSKAAAGEMRKESMRAVIQEAIAEIPLDQLAKAQDPNELKLGIAQVLMVEEHAGKRYTWSGVEELDGTPSPYTLENRLKFLGWKGVMAEISGTRFANPVRYFGQAADVVMEQARRHETPEGMVRLTEFDGNPRNEAGEILWVPAFAPEADAEGKPVELPYGDRPVGDAIADWLLDEAEAGDSIHGAVLEEAAANLDGSPSGERATSEG